MQAQALEISTANRHRGCFAVDGIFLGCWLLEFGFFKGGALGC